MRKVQEGANLNKFVLFFFFILLSGVDAKLLPYHIEPRGAVSEKIGIKILDSKELKFKKLYGIKITEISALAYKAPDILYGLSDRGFLYRFKISIKNNKIKKLKLKDAVKLRDKKYRVLDYKDRDSEGMAIFGDKLLISFERKARVESFSLNGVELKKQKINKLLRDLDNYQSKNKELEAVAYNDKYGIITAPELPLKGKGGKYHTLYTKKHRYKFSASGSITELEFIDENSILVLQRDFNYITRRRITTLTVVYLNECYKHHICKSKELAKLDSARGWHIDNFEGLTKVGDNRFLMVSDDNDSFFQKTLLVLFEIL